MRYEKPEIELMGDAGESVKVIYTLNMADFEPSTWLLLYIDPCPLYIPWEW